MIRWLCDGDIIGPGDMISTGLWYVPVPCGLVGSSYCAMTMPAICRVVNNRPLKTTSHCEIKRWPQIRRAIISRDNGRCRICQREDGEVSLHVHHIDYHRSNNDYDNLVTLCSPCHHSVHGERYIPDGDYMPPWGDHPRPIWH